MPDLRQVVIIGQASWDELVAKAASSVSAEELARVSRAAPSDAINIQYTSGTTVPLGATLSHHNILNNGYLSARSAATPRPTGSASRFPSTTVSMVMGNLAATTHGS